MVGVKKAAVQLQLNNADQSKKVMHSRESRAPSDWHTFVTFTVTCADTRIGDEVVLLGSRIELGLWDINKAVRLTTDAHSFPQWTTEVSMSGAGIPFEFKFLIKSSDGRCRWESVERNRRANIYGDSATLDCGGFGNCFLN
jgi:hypothetical protein